MKKIEVEVSENASIAEISAKIAKQLIKTKQLEFKGKNSLLLTDGKATVEVIENGIQINVTRKLGKHDELKKCHCGVEYMKSAGFKYKTNYGGTNRVLTVCSKKCFEPVKEMCGDRVAELKQKLTPIVNIPDYIEFAPSVTTFSENATQLRKVNNKLSFYKNGISYQPSSNELKAIYYVLKLTK